MKMKVFERSTMGNQIPNVFADAQSSVKVNRFDRDFQVINCLGARRTRHTGCEDGARLQKGTFSNRLKCFRRNCKIEVS